ncbi:calcium-binding protein [Qipengyuania soli]|uniref:PD40 domain-containing protein n=1 Tax=Qipengyuania soli TaxID=2782568 RepID=A0A7S8F262_9SPHN|nr:calcium-binding protein [Qipengyuania soli]QPC97736.1 PD40 domain-containing protein [Qipengyuania soli]
MPATLISTQGDEDWTLSADGTIIYVAGNDGYLRVYDSQTGALLYQVQLGSDLGAISLSPDGSHLAIVEEIAENVQQTQNWTSNTADVSLYVVDLGTFSATAYTYTVTGSDYTFSDVTWSDADTLQVSQNILPGWSGWAPLSTVELADGSRTLSGSYYAGLGSAASLLTIPDSNVVLLGQLGLSSAEYFLIAPNGSSTASNGIYENNVYGYAEGIEAASGVTADDRIIIVTGGGAHLYTGTMQYVGDLSSIYPSLGYAQGVAFSPDGQRIFFLDGQNQAVVVVDAYNYALVGSVSVSGVNFATLHWGAEIVVSADGEGFYYNTAQGIVHATIDLPDLGTEGPDTLNGTPGDDIINGRGGADTIYGLAGDDWLIGGAGNDNLFGGTGLDIASYEDAPSGVTVDLAITTAQATGGAGSDTLAEIEGLSGSLYNDTLYGDGGNNLLLGFDGNDLLRGRGGDDDIYGENGNDSLYGDAGIDWLFGGDGNDLLDGGTGADRLEGGNGDDIYVVDHFGDEIIETATGGNDTMRVYGFDAVIASSVETLVIMEGAFNATGNFVANTLIGSSESNILTGLGGNDSIDGGSNVDTAVVRGLQSAYTVTQTSTGVFQVTGPDGTDTLRNVEYLQFDNATLRLLPGTGVSVNFNTADRSVYQSAMNNIRDFDGNALGGNGGWLRIGSADVNGDGDVDQILVNRTIGRFATVGTAPDGLVYFADHGWAGETRVAGIYIDPLVAAGQVVAGSANDSQRRFQNDLQIENINRVLGADDYDGDGLQEVYFALTDGTAYLHAYMHADGNIRYANYQSQQQVIDYLTANGFAPSTWAGWFPAGAEPAGDIAKAFDTGLTSSDVPNGLGEGILAPHVADNHALPTGELFF